jgi:multidrug efflux pump subunit AcrA (membrane-fusion protein)
MKKNKTLLRILWIFLSMVFLNGCSGLGQQTTPTPDPAPEEEFNPVVSATGVIVPARWARLSLPGSGIVSELLVGEDEAVRAGDALLQLQGEEKLQAALAAAQLELVAAQRALDDLYKNPDLRAATANQAIVDARLAIRDAERRVKNLSTSSAQADIDQARAVVALAKDKLEKAEEDYKPYAKKPEDNITRAGYLNKKAQAEKLYDDAVRRLNNLLGKTANPLDLDEAQADLQLAQAQLEVAQRDYEMFKDGPDPADIAMAQERISNAQTQIVASQAAMKDLFLIAPFDGTISELYIHTNEWIAPGQSTMLLADLKHLWVETTDLNEIDVARIEEGDAVNVTFDPLPDVVVSGKVARISPKAAEGSGVNYKVVIELDDIPEKLRWGMTAFVDIQVD